MSYHQFQGTDGLFGSFELFLNQGPDTGIPDGWYWQPCFPGCLPDGELQGPFNTEAAAMQAAQDGAI